MLEPVIVASADIDPDVLNEKFPVAVVDAELLIEETNCLINIDVALIDADTFMSASLTTVNVAPANAPPALTIVATTLCTLFGVDETLAETDGLALTLLTKTLTPDIDADAEIDPFDCFTANEERLSIFPNVSKLSSKPQLAN